MGRVITSRVRAIDDPTSKCDLRGSVTIQQNVLLSGVGLQGRDLPILLIPRFPDWCSGRDQQTFQILSVSSKLTGRPTLGANFVAGVPGMRSLSSWMTTFDNSFLGGGVGFASPRFFALFSGE